MVYPVTGSTLGSNISTGLSTQILIKVENDAVGAVQSLSITHTRGLFRVPEIGLDGILEIVPNKATEYQAQVTRIVFDRLRLTEALKRGFINIKSQLLPFDIQIIDRTNGIAENSVVHTLVNCWFQNYNPKYNAGDFIVQEDATILFEDIRTTLGKSQESAVIGGDRGIEPQTDTFGRETATDVIYRGTMDVSNVINAAFPE